MGMKTLKNVFHLGKKDKRIDDVLSSCEEELVVEGTSSSLDKHIEDSSSSLDKAGNEQDAKNDWLDRQSVHSEAKSFGTQDPGGRRKQFSARKSRRALREESKRALDMELVKSSRRVRSGQSDENKIVPKNTHAPENEESDNLGEDFGIVIKIPVAVNGDDSSRHASPSSSLHRSRSRSRDTLQRRKSSRDGHLKRSSSKRPDKAQEKRRSRSANVRRNKTNEQTLVGQQAKKQEDKNEHADLDSNGKGPVELLEKSNLDGEVSTGGISNDGRNRTGSAKEYLCNKVVAVKPEESKEADKEEIPHPQEKRSRRSSSRDRRPDRRSSSRDRPKSSRSKSREGRTARSSSRDVINRASSHDRSRRSSSRDPKLSSKRSSSRDRLTSSEHPQERKNRSRSNDRRGVRRTKSNDITIESQKGIMLLLGEGTEQTRRPSVDETFVMSNKIEVEIDKASKINAAKIDILDDQTCSELVDFKEAPTPIYSDEKSAEKEDFSLPADSVANNNTDSCTDNGTARMSSVPHHRSSRRTLSRDKRKRKSGRDEKRQKDEKDSRNSEHSALTSCNSLGGSRHNNPLEPSDIKAKCRSDQQSDPLNEKQIQRVAVVFRDENGNIGHTKEEVKDNDEKAIAVHEPVTVAVEVNPAVALLSHLGDESIHGENENTVNVLRLVSAKPEQNIDEVEEQNIDGEEPLSKSAEPKHPKNNDNTLENTDPKTMTTSGKLGKPRVVAVDVVIVDKKARPNDASKREETSDTLRNAEQTDDDRKGSEKEKRRAARKARREKKANDMAKQSKPKSESNIATLLGMIGSTEDDFKSTGAQNIADLLDSQPKSSVDFFQSLSSPNNGSSLYSKKEVERGVTRRKSSDDVLELGSSPSMKKNTSRKGDRETSASQCLSKSEHVTSGSRITRDDIKSAKKTQKIQHQKIVEEDDDKDSLPPPSLEGDIDVRHAKNNRKIKCASAEEASDEGDHLAPPSLEGDFVYSKKSKFGEKDILVVGDAFDLLGEETNVLGNAECESPNIVKDSSKSRKIRRAKNIGSGEGDNICEQSLAPPSLAGDKTISTEKARKKKGLQSVKESESVEESPNDVDRHVPIRNLPNKAQSFAMLQDDDVDDDSLGNGFLSSTKQEKDEEEKKKRRKGMMKTMKKARSALTVVGRRSKVLFIDDKGNDNKDIVEDVEKQKQKPIKEKDSDEATEKRRRKGMMKKMKKATSALAVVGKMSKATSLGADSDSHSDVE